MGIFSDEFDDRINAVKDKYEDFLHVFDSSKLSDEVQRQIILFLRKNPDANTSQVIFKYGQIRGKIPKDAEFPFE